MIRFLFVCDQPRTDAWQPDFTASSQMSPTWTRVSCRGLQITNSLEWVEWTENPVQVVLCDVCGQERCASGGWVHVSRLDRHVLWSAPQATGGSPRAEEGEEVPRFIRTLGAVALPVEIWNGWSAAIPEVPRADRLPPANHAAVADAWILGPARSTPTLLATLQDRLVGGDTLEKPAAIAMVARMMEHLEKNAFVNFPHPVVEAAGARIETLYFDGPSELDWPAFAFAGEDTYLALTRELMVQVDV